MVISDAMIDRREILNALQEATARVPVVVLTVNSL
jgi:hypothetical protein